MYNGMHFVHIIFFREPPLVTQVILIHRKAIISHSRVYTSYAHTHTRLYLHACNRNIGIMQKIIYG